MYRVGIFAYWWFFDAISTSNRADDGYTGH